MRRNADDGLRELERRAIASGDPLLIERAAHEIERARGVDASVEFLERRLREARDLSTIPALLGALRRAGRMSPIDGVEWPLIWSGPVTGTGEVAPVLGAGETIQAYAVIFPRPGKAGWNDPRADVFVRVNGARGPGWASIMSYGVTGIPDWIQWLRNVQRLLPKPKRKNMDVDLRAIEREASAGDPSAQARLAVARARAGFGVRTWYAENIAPLGVPEEDFRVLLRVLVREWHGSRGPRNWAWLAAPIPVESQDEVRRHALPLFRDAYVLAVRTTHREPDNQEFFDDTITVGVAESARQIDGHGDNRVHPREAWPELAERPGIDGPRRQFPAFYYTNFEEKFRGPDVPHPETPRWLRSLEVLPSGTTTASDGLVGGHGCESRAPNAFGVHADDPTHMMYAWARRADADRVVIPVMDARVYVGLDPLTGLSRGAMRSMNPAAHTRRNHDEDLRELRRLYATTNDPSALKRLYVATERAGQHLLPDEEFEAVELMLASGDLAEDEAVRRHEERAHDGRSTRRETWLLLELGRPLNFAPLLHPPALGDIYHGERNALEGPDGPVRAMRIARLMRQVELDSWGSNAVDRMDEIATILGSDRGVDTFDDPRDGSPLYVYAGWMDFARPTVFWRHGQGCGASGPGFLIRTTAQTAAVVERLGER